MAYIGRGLGGEGVRQRYLFTATSGQTTFDTSDSGTGLSYSDTNYMDVYLNGVLLDPASDYTATSGTSVVLGSGATAGDTVECVVYDVFSVFSGNFNTNVSVNGNLDVTQNVSIAGNLTVDTNTLYVDSTNNRIGLGTAAPVSKVDVVHTSDTRMLISEEATNTSTLATVNTANTAYSDLNIYSNNLKLSTSGAERMRIDSSGNVGIGTSPSFTFGSGLEVQRAGISTVRVENSSVGVSGELSAYDGTYGTLLYTLSAHPITFGTSGGERMKIDASGRITSITQPSFQAYKTNTNFTAPATILFNSVVYNVGSCYNAANGTFTAPVTGTYYFNARALLSSGNSNGYYYMDFVHNGSVNVRDYHYVANSEFKQFEINKVLTLAANDTIIINAQASGTWYGVNGIYTQFSGRLLV